MRLLLTGILLCAFTLPLQAHDLPRSESTVTVQGAAVRVRLRINLLELRGARWTGGEVVSYPELESSIDSLYASIKTHFRIDGSADLLRTGLERYDLEDGHVLRMDLAFHFAGDISSLAVTSTLDQLMQPGHVHFTSVTFGGSVQQAALDASAPRRQFVALPGTSWTTAASFLRLGVWHIAGGYDHLALLIALMTVTCRVRSLLAVASAFTLAHTVALALAAYDLVVLPTRMTESLIALSVVFLACENLIGAGIASRWGVACLFALAHGLGFANVLREMQLPRASLALSLFSFNTGIEVGQLLFVAATLWLVTRAALMWRPLRPTVSAVIGAAAIYWLVQRAFLA